MNDADRETPYDSEQPGVSALSDAAPLPLTPPAPALPAALEPARYTSNDLPPGESRRVFREKCASGRVAGARREGQRWICTRDAWHHARAWTPPNTAAPPHDADEAIRTAAKLAIDAGDVDRARALLDLLDTNPRTTATVLTLAARKPAG